MGVYIPKMEMPSKKNGAVIILYSNGTAVFEDGKEYQVVEVKPHGRLIDVDEAYNAFLNLVKIQGGINPCQLGTILVNAPTIIEAEGEDG